MNTLDDLRIKMKQAKQALDGLQWKHDGWCESGYPDPFPCDCRIMVAQDKIQELRSFYSYYVWRKKHRTKTYHNGFYYGA